MQISFPKPEQVGENALARFAKKPFDDFKENSEFSPIDGILEEILGRLGCLRRNQRIVDVGSPVEGVEIPNSIKLMRDHDMVVLNVNRIGDDTQEIEKEFRNLIVATNVFDEPLDDILDKHMIQKEFSLLNIDSSTIETTRRPYVVSVVINPSTHPSLDFEDGFKKTMEFWKEKGYTCITMVEKYVIFVRDDLVKQLNIKGVFLRNPELCFDWKYV